MAARSVVSRGVSELTAIARRAVAREVDNLAPARRLRLRLARDEIETALRGRDSVRVLDAGCQNGHLALDLARRHPSWEIVACDIDADVLAHVAAAAEEARLGNLRTLRADITAALDAAPFDAITAIECLTEIGDDHAALQHLCERLVPGGVLCVHVPRQDWRPVLPGSPTQWYNNVRSGYDPEAIAQELSMRGLRVVTRPTTHAVVHAAEEVRFRWVRRWPRRGQAVMAPLLRAAMMSETVGVRLGRPRGLLVVGTRLSE